MLPRQGHEGSRPQKPTPHPCSSLHFWVTLLPASDPIASISLPHHFLCLYGVLSVLLFRVNKLFI